MNWIIFGVFFILTHQHPPPHQRSNIFSKSHMLNSIMNGGGGGNAVLATPLIQEPSPTINPFIKHWEAAKFDRTKLEIAHKNHEAHRRRKRNINYDQNMPEYGPGNIIRLNFFAHDREFRLLLREDPNSVFSKDIQIENSEGPLDYDLSRIYSGVLEDDENSYAHGILTADNLFDGTITTNFEQYYIEPSIKYSNDLENQGIHTIIYKMSDVKIKQDHHKHNDDEDDDDDGVKIKANCASEKLFKLIKNEFSNKLNQKSEDINYKDDKLKYNKNNINKVLSTSSSTPATTSYNKNDKKTKDIKRRKRWLLEEVSESRNPSLPLDLEVPYNDDFTVNRNSNLNLNFKEKSTNSQNKNNGQPFQTPPTNNRKNHFLINTYNPNSDHNLRNPIITRNRNIITNVFENNQNNNNNNNSYSPNHKTHVEIITKNGATKKNIIVNNYDPDVVFTNTNNNFNLNVRNDLSDQQYNQQKIFSSSMYDRKSTCMLYLQADHTFFQKMGSDEASIEAITRHVQRANSIYRKTDFNGDGKPDNITFMIKRIKVHNMNALKDPTYRFPGNYGVEKFLELFSEEDYDAFCLAYMFTYRDFEMGTLGLAWTGDLKNAGGVCEKNGHYRGSLKSLNTGIVTLLNYGKHVPPAVSHVTLAHEIGHNFGSPHDPEQCTPGGEDGNFIMFARATSGDKRNNNRFSPCSLKAIEPVLNAKARSAKGCFTEPQQSICGNGVVEQGEQCDCGWEEDCKDTCCYPMSRHPRFDQKPCTLTPRAQCSPSQGPCCKVDCSLKIGDKCRDDNGCRDPSYCDGNMPQCPPSVNKPNKTICNKEFVCYMGECTGSICLAYGLESCQCIPGPNDLKTKSCELCCKQPGESSPCKSSFEWNDPPFDVPDMFAKPGTPCNDYNGYCDVFQKCREVDPSGPLATLRKLLLSEESIATFKKWILSNWYAVALIVAAIFALLVLSTKLLGKRTNLKLKTVTIIHSATTETVRLPDDNNGVIVHTAIRSKVPLKKKVRGERSKPKSTNQPKQLVATAAGTTSAVKTTVMPTPSTSKDHSQPQSSSMNTANVVIKHVKRHVAKVSSSDSPKKLIKKKKKRVSAPIVAEEQQQQQEPVKVKKFKKSKSKHKEIIDYSNRSDNHNHTNTFGKVHKWLLESPIVSNASSQFEHASKVTNVMSKSQSTPDNLVTQRSPNKTKVKTKSVGNLNEKVRLQVVYKPPFKFSLKLSKNEGTVKTNVVGGAKRKSRMVDRKRVAAAVQASKDESSRRRTAILVRPAPTAEDSHPIINAQEPNYETLNPKNPNYENMSQPNTSSANAINTATFRINKSASGSNIINSNSHYRNPSITSMTNFKSTQRGSATNLNQVGSHSNSNSRERDKIRRSSINNSHLNLAKQYGGDSTENLIRSSTTNLSKHKRNSFADKKRSSTTNLNLVSGSNSNLNSIKRNGSNQHLNYDGTSSNSRRNSTSVKPADSTNSMKKTKVSRTHSNSNIPTIRRSSVSNIPRASLAASNNLTRQTSLNVNVKHHPINDRPHTTACDDAQKFDWPSVILPSKQDEPLPSDLEVMVSDVENLVNDR